MAALKLRPDHKRLVGVSNMAGFAGVAVTTYRRHILPLPNHPAPLDREAARKVYVREEVVEFLSDSENWRY